MSTTAPEPLSLDFPPTSYQDWRTVAEADLKGADFEKKLVTPTYEGIPLQPIYRREDVADLPFADSLPGLPPYTRGSQVAGFLTESWDISQQLPYASPREFNHAARHDLARGLTALNLHLDAATRSGLDPDWAKEGDVGRGGVSIATLRALSVALEDIDLEKIPVFVRSGASAFPFAALLIALARQRSLSVKKIRGCVEMDPLGVLSHEGTLPQSIQEAYREMFQLTQWASINAPQLQTICVHSRPYHESGSSAVQELAFAVATGVEYLREMLKLGLDVDTVAQRMLFAFSVGSPFFMEIAKLRAARLIWSRVIESFGGSAESACMSIHARTCDWNKSRLDPYVNMLRTTTEAFASVLGGCDSLQVGAFDEVFGMPDEFSRRIARNTQIILKHEAKLCNVVDPVGGSWYIEKLTHQLAEQAWALFQKVEQQGGMLSALQQKFPQQEVEKTATQRERNLASRKDIMIGVNQYANPTEKTLPLKSLDYRKIYLDRVNRVLEFRTSFDSYVHTQVLQKLTRMMDSSDDEMMEAAIEAAASGATLGEITRVIRASHGERICIQALKPHRVAESFEALRSASEAYLAKHGKRPQIFLLNMGRLSQHKARADFSRGFFEVAGMEVIYPKGFESAQDAVTAFSESGAGCAVLCSTDDTYPELVPAVTQLFKAKHPNAPLILAGYPTEHVEAFKQAGIDNFIHVRADVLQTLTDLLKRLGVL